MIAATPACLRVLQISAPVDRLSWYDLLGLKPFEDDPGRIQAALEQTEQRLRAIIDGPDLKTAQELLNHLAACRLCLLDPRNRDQYNDQLRRSQSGGRSSVEKVNHVDTSGDDQESLRLLVTTQENSMGSRSPNAETSHSSVWLLGLAGTGLSLLVVILILALRNGREQRPSRETVERQRATDGDRSHASNHTANTEGSGATTAVGPENGMAPDDPGQTILSKAAVGPDSVPNPGNPSGTSVADLRLAVEKLKPLLWISAPDRELIPARHSDNDFGRRRTGTFRGLPAFELQDELIDIVIPEKYLRTEFSGWTIVYLASGEGILLSTGDPYLNPGEFFSITAKGHFRVRTGKQQFVHDRRHSSSDLIARVVDYDGKRIRLHTGGDESAEQVFGPTRKRIVKIRLGGRISEDSKRERSDRFRGWLIELVLFDRRLNEEELNRVIRLMQSRVAMSTNQ